MKIPQKQSQDCLTVLRQRHKPRDNTDMRDVKMTEMNLEQWRKERNKVNTERAH